MSDDLVIEAVEFTDPFCSYAWGTEPKYRRLAWQYGEFLELRRVFVGILSPGSPGKDYDQTPEGLRVRYEKYLLEVTELTGMPYPSPVHHMMDGSDRICRIARAVQRQGPDVAERVLRRVRESLFIDGAPADDLPRTIAAAAGVPGFDADRLAADLADPDEEKGYQDEWEEARRPNDHSRNEADKRPGRGAAQQQDGQWRYGLPCLVLTGSGGTATIAGWRSWPEWEAALETVAPGVTAKARPLPTPEQAFERWPSLTSAELAELCGPAAGRRRTSSSTPGRAGRCGARRRRPAATHERATGGSGDRRLVGHGAGHGRTPVGQRHAGGRVRRHVGWGARGTEPAGRRRRCRCRGGRIRRGGKGTGSRRGAGQQRRDRRRARGRAVPRVRHRGLGPRARRQRARAVPLQPRGVAGDAREGLRPDRHHRLDRRHGRDAYPLRLHSLEGRGADVRQVPRGGLRAKGIRSNAICPGGVYTPMVSARIDAGVFDIPKLVPLGYVAKPADIAHAVYLLASGQLDYMNGSAWVIDGGWTAL